MQKQPFYINIYTQIIKNTTRETLAIFNFMGPFLKLSTRFIVGESGSACLNISNVFAKGKKMFLFSYFGPCLSAYFRNKDFQHFLLFYFITC